MSLKPQLKEIDIKFCKKLDDVNIKNSISLTTNGEKIDKVLFAKSCYSIKNITTNKFSVLIEGVVNSYALTKLENGEITTLRSSSNFSTTYNSNQIEQDDKIFFNKQNCDVENLSVNEISISFSSQIILNLFVVKNQKLKYVDDISPANQKIGTTEVSTITHVLKEDFDCVREIDLPSSISKVLLVESFVCLKDAVCSKDLITISGEVVSNLIYLTSDENPKLKSQIYTNDFNQEILASGVFEGQNLQIELSACLTEFNIEGEISSSKGVLQLKNQIQANIVAKKLENIEMVFDAFCPRKEMQMEYSSFVNQKLVYEKNSIEKIDGMISLPENDQRIDKVLFSSNGQVLIKNFEIKDEDVLITGVVNCFVVYQLDDEKNTLESANIEIPFETSVACDNLKAGDDVFVSAFIKDIDARNKRAKEIDVLGELNLKVVVNRTENEGVLSNIVVGENRTSQMPNMAIYVVEKADDVWDIAKKLLINPDVLLSQNPEITFPIMSPTQLIVYRQKEINF